MTSILLALLWTPPLLAAPSQIRFENRQKHSGVSFVLDNGTTEDKPIIDSVLGGVALLDYDNDGYLDIFFTNGASIPGLSKDSSAFYNRLYHNNRDGTFTDVTARARFAARATAWASRRQTTTTMAGQIFMSPGSIAISCTTTIMTERSAM